MALKGEIRLPGDKSLSHRALIFAALAEGRSQLRNLSCGVDVATTASLLQNLGVEAQIFGSSAIVVGCGLSGFHAKGDSFDCGNSGTTLRLIMGLLAGSDLTCTLAGDQSLNRRPVMRVIEPLRLMGAEIFTELDADHPPVTIVGRSLHGIDYESPVASAQVKSAVLLAAMNAESATTYSEPSKSRDHTERFLLAQGIELAVADTRLRLDPGGALQPFEYAVPGDISTAAFYIVAALLAQGSEVKIIGIGLNPTRCGVLEILRKMGADIRVENEHELYGEPVGDLIVRSSSLHAVDTTGMNVASFIDEAPILAVAAMFAEGESRFAALSELRVKESDRLQGMAEIVNSFGGAARIEKDDLIIVGGEPHSIREPEIHRDHRLAMSVEVLNLLLAGEPVGTYQESIMISAPEFYDTMRTLSE